MIRLELTDKPKKLTSKVVSDLTDKFIADGSSVWNKPFIRQAVLNFSHSKCCYTECKLDVESKYMEVDHFYPKKYFPNEVLIWGNLLPSCKKSNTTKGELNTKKFPIINPTIDNPKDHLIIKDFRYYHKSEIGKRTITFTALNDRKHFVNKRYEIGIKAIEILEDIYDGIEAQMLDLTNNLQIKKYVNRYKNLLQEATRTEEYSASTSSVILTNHHNQLIIDLLKLKNMWDEELIELIKELNFCSLID